MRILLGSISLLLMVCGAPAKPTTGAIAKDKADKYYGVEFRTLIVSPEDYKNKRVTYIERFLNFSATFFPYMEKSGFKPDKYLMLEIGKYRLPVVAKKTKEITQFVSGLNADAYVKVFGKIRRFRAKPKRTIRPHYFLELEHIHIVHNKQVGSGSPKRSTIKWPGQKGNRFQSN